MRYYLIVVQTVILISLQVCNASSSWHPELNSLRAAHAAGLARASTKPLIQCGAAASSSELPPLVVGRRPPLSSVGRAVPTGDLLSFASAVFDHSDREELARKNRQLSQQVTELMSKLATAHVGVGHRSASVPPVVAAYEEEARAHEPEVLRRRNEELTRQVAALTRQLDELRAAESGTRAMPGGAGMGAREAAFVALGAAAFGFAGAAVADHRAARPQAGRSPRASHSEVGPLEVPSASAAVAARVPGLERELAAAQEQLRAAQQRAAHFEAEATRRPEVPAPATPAPTADVVPVTPARTSHRTAAWTARRNAAQSARRINQLEGQVRRQQSELAALPVAGGAGVAAGREEENLRRTIAQLQAEIDELRRGDTGAPGTGAEADTPVRHLVRFQLRQNASLTPVARNRLERLLRQSDEVAGPVGRARGYITKAGEAQRNEALIAARGDREAVERRAEAAQISAANSTVQFPVPTTMAELDMVIDSFITDVVLARLGPTREAARSEVVRAANAGLPFRALVNNLETGKKTNGITWRNALKAIREATALPDEPLAGAGAAAPVRVAPKQYELFLKKVIIPKLSGVAILQVDEDSLLEWLSRPGNLAKLAEDEWKAWLNDPNVLYYLFSRDPRDPSTLGNPVELWVRENDGANFEAQVAETQATVRAGVAWQVSGARRNYPWKAKGSTAISTRILRKFIEAGLIPADVVVRIAPEMARSIMRDTVAEVRESARATLLSPPRIVPSLAASHDAPDFGSAQLARRTVARMPVPSLAGADGGPTGIAPMVLPGLDGTVAAAFAAAGRPSEEDQVVDVAITRLAAEARIDSVANFMAQLKGTPAFMELVYAWRATWRDSMTIAPVNPVTFGRARKAAVEKLSATIELLITRTTTVRPFTPVEWTALVRIASDNQRTLDAEMKAILEANGIMHEALAAWKSTWRAEDLPAPDPSKFSDFRKSKADVCAAMVLALGAVS